MKKIVAVVLAGLIITSFNCMAQDQVTDTVWRTGGFFSLNLGQSSFTNWAAGGQNSYSLNGLINLTANYKKDKSAWDNALIFGYGMMRLKEGTPEWTKTDDRIDLQSKYGRKASGKWYYSALMSFKTQMSDGYNYPDTENKISDFLAPGYLLFSLGMDYKPTPQFSAFLSPLTVKTTFVNDNYLSSIGAFGVEAGKKVRGEFGAYANLTYKKDEIMKNVNFATRLDLFSNYLHNPQNIDVNWETMLILKVNEFLSATVNTLLIYDDDVLIKVDEGSEGEAIMGKRTQFKEVIGVGLTYRFAKFK
jgi:hypothetical protein